MFGKGKNYKKMCRVTYNDQDADNAVSGDGDDDEIGDDDADVDDDVDGDDDDALGRRSRLSSILHS